MSPSFAVAGSQPENGSALCEFDHLLSSNYSTITWKSNSWVAEHLLAEPKSEKQCLHVRYFHR